MIAYKTSLLGKLPRNTIRKLGKLTFGTSGVMYNHIEVVLLNLERGMKVDENEFVVVAYDGDKPVAWALSMMILKGTSYIGVYVKSDYRRKGIGTELVNKLKGILKGKGVKKIHVEPHDEASDEFYSGFKGARKSGPHPMNVGPGGYPIWAKKIPISESMMKERPDIVVGAVTPDGVISSNDLALHSELGKEFNYNLFGKRLTERFGNHWRYNAEDKTVYWWGNVGDEVQQSDVEAHLEKKYRYKVERHLVLNTQAPTAEQDVYMKRYKAAHGFAEWIVESHRMNEIGSKIIVGFIMNDDSVISSDKDGNHEDLMAHKRIKNGDIKFSWRYNKEDGVVYWWPQSYDKSEIDKINVATHIQDRYGKKVRQNKMIGQWGQPINQQAYDASHAMEEAVGNESLRSKKLIVVGDITDNGDVVSSDKVGGHEGLRRDSPGNSYGPYQWRFRKDLKTLYWYKSPPVEWFDLVKDHIEHKYGVEVKKSITITSNNQNFFRLLGLAHGGDLIEDVKENMKRLLTEGIKEKAAEDFIRQTIKGTEWEGKVFVAGGYVRDEFMGKDPKDLDLLVNKPNGGIEFAIWITKKIGAHSEGNPVTFLRFGTAKFNLRGIIHNGIDISDMDIEAVMPRKEQYTAGSRKPDVSVGELKDDVERRDFTVNSLLKDLSSGEVLDLTGMGKDDIKAGIIRTPLSTDKIFTDDPLRMLRAVRFTMKYDWKLPMFMIRGLKKNASQLKNISEERIRDELDKMLMTGSPDRAIKLLKVTGLLQYVIPELKTAVGMTQNIHHKKDVFGHTLDVLKKTQPVLIQRLAALLHDIGKIVTRSVTPTGVHFYGHEDAGEKIAEDIMRRLKYPVELINSVKLIVRNHMRLKQIGDVDIKISDKALRKLKFDLGDELENTLNVIHADNIAHADASAMPNQIANVRKRLDSLKAVATKPKLPISGNDLITMGFKQGPIFKDILSAVTEAWFENPNITKEEALKIVGNFKK